MIKAIIFDADGVLVKSEFLSTRLIKDRGAQKEHFDKFFAGPFQNCLIGKADLREEITRAWPIWKWDGDVDSLLALWFAEDANRIDARFGSVIADLKSRGIICALGTNNEKYRTDDLLHNKGLAKWFKKHHVFSSGYVGKKKPDQGFFAHVSEALQLKPSEIAFWDDDPENVAAARLHGMQANHYTSFDEFMRWVEGIK